MSAVLFIARAFDVGVIAPNAVQYIQSVFLTSDGSNSWTTGIILDGTTNGWITITNLPSKSVLGTDANGKITGSSASVIYNLISSLVSGGWATWPAGPQGIQWLPWLQGNTWATGLQGLPWVAWATWPIGPQGIQWLQWPQGNTWATGWFSSLNCTAWQIAKYNGTIRECSGDLQWWGWWIDRYTTGMNFNSGNNILTLYVSGSNSVTGSITLSGVNNWNTAYGWVNTSWNSLWNRSVTTGKFLRDWYNNIGIHINTLATATLNCTTGQIAKYNGATRACAPDLWALPFTADSHGYSYIGNISIGTNSISSNYRTSMFKVLWDMDVGIQKYTYTLLSNYVSDGSEQPCWLNACTVNGTCTSQLFDFFNHWWPVCSESRDDWQGNAGTVYYQQAVSPLNIIKTVSYSDMQIWYKDVNLWLPKIDIQWDIRITTPQSTGYCYWWEIRYIAPNFRWCTTGSTWAKLNN